jgi:hypothetical protein
MEINAYNIRAILMYYFRFKRQFVACSEVPTDCYELSDVLVMSKKHMIEVEIKVSKQDLIKGEAKKKKHKKEDSKRIVNKYFICVPTELVEDAKIWIDKTNKKYGLIEIKGDVDKEWRHSYENHINIVKNAKLLQPKFYEILKDKMLKRLSSALTSLYLGKMV